MDVSVGLVGSGPAAESVAAALGDIPVSVEQCSPDELSDHRLAVVIDRVGSERFRSVNDERDGPWVAIELGGIGGVSIAGVSASVVGFAPETGCYRCLGSRVGAGDVETDEADVDPGDARLAGALAGNRLAATLQEGNELFGRVLELPYTERRLLPIPTCDRCGGPSGPPTEAGEERSVEEAIAHAEGGVDDRLGIVRTVGEIASFPAPYYLATAAETTDFSDASAPTQAAGVAPDWDAAYMKALGEAFERYSAGVYRDEWFEYARSDDLDDAIAPERFVRAEPTDTEIPWVVGERLDTDEPVSIPAEFVQFPPPEKRFGSAITTGLGLGNTRSEALLSGLYEVIERDATMLAWYSTFEPLGLGVEDETVATLTRRAASEGLSVTPLLVTQDVDVPVVAVAVHRESETGNDGEWPRFALGSAADLDATAAVRSALCEALQNWMELRSMGAETAGEESGWIGRYASFPEPAADLIEVSGQIQASAVGSEPLDSERELDSVVSRLGDVGLSPSAAWLTPVDVRELGFEAVRVVVPEAQPLFTREPVFGERARSVPASMGFDPRLERDPHPYP
ncbi:YcaO-like family protein [Halalkalicoccus subterraneus]|uniref:YcaO-like family protein n=1 Tax=Halalkalicoccus subterraneus TaxID=2675002 RepID=UPI000EFB7E19|nr:YcaO-like family protein [Halalkalicoccus subterraneus]